ncbi:hypothetical protein CPIN18021_0990 [Campylobacter pinnipediorum subsp. caledonicus]|uniref:Acyl carrier protein n=1 Tax=Campylobacter pinnipediorum subsp. caledonicus TaxID=1874362 RepID=A0A1S6U7S7_9BACT|nr:hypothetical protein [Campylobacter pinnipediorum]AQW81325.1 hypothetical protein CPIN17260_1033 [Campylobacter pinnipediorum subsp. pinnipediorum]AQW86189.1 hypothetical protein CPIN18020_0988 [Campylobacter pinnipediorum subsp. caledonicus]AQW87796.1 hypothetical protein CPIN18021_0990 [Campylobacter pinnipediorum subsp. caledonicus]
MNHLKRIFEKIGKPNIDVTAKNMITSGILDSIDIMKIIVEIDTIIGKPLDSKFIKIENFESFDKIENMIKEAMNEQ